MSDFSGLRVSGHVAVPGDSDWDQARLAWNLAADQNPEAVVFAESAGEGQGSTFTLTLPRVYRA